MDETLEAKIFTAHAEELKRKEAELSMQVEEAKKTASVPAQSFGSVDCNAQKCAALSFDDGPGSHTEQLLGILGKYNVKATFFMIGRQVPTYASVVNDVAKAGHEIGIHTWDHKNLTKISDAEVLSQVNKTKDAVAQAAGVRPVLVRPPYGAINDHVMSLLNAPIIMWNVDPEDWKDHDADIVYNRVVSHAANGTIILSHDIHPTTVTAYERIVPKLLDEGFKLVTVSELLGLDPANPVSQKYFSR